MELVTVNITGQAITARYGILNTGDVLRTDAEFARHLVEDCGAAAYPKAKSIPVKNVSASPVEQTKKSKSQKIERPITSPQDHNDPTINQAAD